MTKVQYKIAKKSGTITKLRNDKISAEIGKKVPFPKQIAIAMNALDDLYAKMSEIYGEDFRSEELKEYQRIRAEAKVKVDATRAEMEEQLK
ncbi:MAG: hypothetical protein IJX38_01280 [Clostridia bacterium]|nr:hypothetical protein [Clostridia bacterium]